MNTWTPQYYTANPMYANQTAGSSTAIATNNQDFFADCGSANGNTGCTGSFTGAAGTGFGTLAARPSTCTANSDPTGETAAPTGVGYWATDTNTLYVCGPTANTWTTYYTPYTYPNPLVGGGGTMVLSPGGENYGAVNLGSSSSPATFTLNNNSSSSATSLTISNVGGNTGDFIISSNTCGSTLAANASCGFNVTFTPVTGIGRSTTLTATYSGADNAGKQTAALSGTTNGTSAASIVFAGTTFLNGETLLP
jgi:hypothetical protein